MKLNKSQGDLLKRVIERWEADGTIDVSTADRLKESYTVRSFEWKELAKYSFWIAIVCGVIAVVSVLADHLIMDLLERLFLSSYSLTSGVFAVGAALVYYWGWRRRKRMPYKVFSNETILFLGVLLTASRSVTWGRPWITGAGIFLAFPTGGGDLCRAGLLLLVGAGVGVCLVVAGSVVRGRDRVSE